MGFPISTVSQINEAFFQVFFFHYFHAFLPKPVLRLKGLIMSRFCARTKAEYHEEFSSRKWPHVTDTSHRSMIFISSEVVNSPETAETDLRYSLVISNDRIWISKIVLFLAAWNSLPPSKTIQLMYLFRLDHGTCKETANFIVVEIKNPCSRQDYNIFFK